MMQHGPLIPTIVAGLTVAFIFGLLSHRLRVSPLAGYLLAGIIVGPFTPGFVADGGLAAELAEIGVILLMFGVGLHFSLRDLLSVRHVAVPGAIGQIAVATLAGVGLAMLLGWSLGAGIVFGLALSVASTVVLLRALQVRNLLHTERGRIAVGWLIVEDLAMVLALVLLPAVASAATGAGVTFGAFVGALALTLLKVSGFVAFMLLIARRAIPALLHYVAHTGSRELFRLAVLVMSLGVAFGAAMLFDVSFALGAFFAGIILGETRLSQRAAEETMPLRDAFAVLFFVSVGMLFDPRIIIEQPLPLLATVTIIIVGKSLASYVIVRLFGHPHGTALVISASLGQIGEFSFILAALGVSLNLLPPDGQDLVLAGAMFSILINPFLFNWIGRLDPEALGVAEQSAPGTPPPAPDAHGGHVVLVGYGRVGRRVGQALMVNRTRLVVIEEIAEQAEAARRDGAEVIVGNAASPEVLAKADLAKAAQLLVAIPEGFDAGQVVEQARHASADLAIIVRAHSDAEVAHLRRLGSTHVVMSEDETARRMLSLAMPATATL
ncbi:YbaL family putative K(+) efflux transporter [Parapedomonas caeni]